MELFTISIVVLFIIIAASCFLLFRRPRNYPPGPTGNLILGNIVELGQEGYKVGLELTKKYGDIIGLRLGTRKVVMLSNVDDIRIAFTKQEFAGKSLYYGLIGQTSGDRSYGIIMSQGRIWREQRNFASTHLRGFGLGSRSMQDIIMTEVNELIDKFRKNKEEPFSTELSFNAPAFNVVWSIVASERYPHDDPVLAELTELLSEHLASATKGIQPWYFMFPFLVHLRSIFLFLFRRFEEPKQFITKGFPFFRKSIQSHRNTMVEDKPRDLIDAYLERVSETTDPKSSFYLRDTDDFELMLLLTDLLLAGEKTVSTTLRWSFFLLALHGNVQDKFYTEMKTVVGDRQVTLDDRPRLPYVEATMMEIMRFSSIAPFASAHATTQDVIFKGYFIPKGTNIWANVYATHHNPSVWGDPDNFRPERFLSAEERIVLRNKNLIPFSVGKRICPGESLARDEFFLFLTTLVRTFHVSMPADEQNHTLRLVPVPVAVPTPEPHRIVLKERNP